jgi:hypothetical protein
MIGHSDGSINKEHSLFSSSPLHGVGYLSRGTACETYIVYLFIYLKHPGFQFVDSYAI